MPTPSSSRRPSRGWCAGSRDPEIGAVAGNAKVGNRINMITRWQALEYIVAQNLERRALSRAGRDDGRAGRGRRLAARGAGGGRRLSRRHAGRGPGSHHRHPARGLAGRHTMPTPSPGPKRPQTVRGLAKQRFRWAFGTLQCLWKHRAHHFNAQAAAGWAWSALPQAWLFQIVLRADLAADRPALVLSIVVDDQLRAAAWLGADQYATCSRMAALLAASSSWSTCCLRLDRLCAGRREERCPAVPGCSRSASSIARSCIMWWSAPSPRRCAAAGSAGASWSAPAAPPHPRPPALKLDRSAARLHAENDPERHMERDQRVMAGLPNSPHNSAEAKLNRTSATVIQCKAIDVAS